MKGPLEGIKVIDLSLLLPGPLCAQHLGDLGAEVIKVENPKVGDMVRYGGSKIEKDGFSESGMFLQVNRNKKAITINIKRPEGREVLFKLLQDADILLEGFRPGAMAKMGLGYDDLKEKFPRLIYCAISGYGATGPYVPLAGHDANYIAYSGLLGINGTEEMPILPGFQVADIGGGTLLALSGILAALYAREKTGKGQFVDIGMMDGAFQFLSLYAGDYFASGKIPKRGKALLSGGLPNYQIYKTKDNKFVVLAALEERFFRNFLRQINREDLLDGIQLGKMQENEEALEKLKPELEKIFASKTRDEWSELFENPDVCLAPVYELNEAMEDKQAKARGLVTEIHHPKLGKIKVLGSPFHFSETPVQYRYHPPAHGEHTVEILKELGYTQEEINKLREKRAI